METPRRTPTSTFFPCLPWLLKEGNVLVYFITFKYFSVFQQVSRRWLKPCELQLENASQQIQKLFLQQLHRKRSQLGMGKIQPSADWSSHLLHCTLLSLCTPFHTSYSLGQVLVICNPSTNKIQLIQAHSRAGSKED